MAKTSDAQKKATQTYREKNREKTRIQSYRSSARTFIRKYAQTDDLTELEELIKKRREELTQNE